MSNNKITGVSAAMILQKALLLSSINKGDMDMKMKISLVIILLGFSFTAFAQKGVGSNEDGLFLSDDARPSGTAINAEGKSAEEAMTSSFVPTSISCRSADPVAPKSTGPTCDSGLKYCEYSKADCKLYYIGKGLPNPSGNPSFDLEMDIKCDRVGNSCPKVEDCAKKPLSEKTRKAIADQQEQLISPLYPTPADQGVR